jgi:hypothetical protein
MVRVPRADPCAPLAEHETSLGRRGFAVAVVVLSAVILLGTPLVAHLRGALLAALGFAVAALLWRDGTRRLHVFGDRLALVQGSRVREVPFREITTWSIPLGEALVLTLRDGQTLRLGRWRRQADLNATLVAAIRVAGSTFETDGRTTRVRW